MLSAFQISCLITSIASLAFGLFVFWNNKKSRMAQLWLLLSLSIGLWSLGLFGVVSAKDYCYAWFWQNILDASGIFIPIFNFSLVLFLFNSEHRYKKFKIFLWIFSFVLLVLSFSNLFKVGLIPNAGFQYWIQGGSLYFLFPLFYLFLVAFSSFFLINTYRNTEDRVVKDRAKYFLLAQLIGFGGGATNFFPQFFNIYPFGNYLVILYLYFISYSILRHGLFNVKVVMAQLLTFVIWVVFLIEFFLAETIQKMAIQGVILLLLIIFGTFLIRSVLREVKTREEMEMLAKKLELANIKLQELDRAKSEFISIASHQLRAPVTAVKGYASMLLEGSFGAVSKKAKVAVERIFDSSNRLVLTIGDFLDVSRIESGRMQYDFSQFDVKEMVSTILEEFKINLAKFNALAKSTKSGKEKNIEITFEAFGRGDFKIMGDPNKLRQVFSNLVDNSIKYTREGFVKVSVSMKANNGGALIKIQDSGIGITKEGMASLFQKFNRAQGTTRVQADGSGLGLFVAKEIVKAHHGKIWAESAGEGKGSAFIIELPVENTPPNKETGFQMTEEPKV